MRAAALLLALGAFLGAQEASAPAPKPLPAALDPGSRLAPGEALVLADVDDHLQGYGEVMKPRPLGGLSRLVWLQLGGLEWQAMDLRYSCPKPEGHGRVDLPKALRVGCSGAFLAWAQASVASWRKDTGDDVARERLREAFGPFLGDRLPPVGPMPEIGPAWVGEGDYLQGSPAVVARWLTDPAHSTALAQAQRHLEALVDDAFGDWWYLAADAPTAKPAGTWVVAGNGLGLAVMHLPGAHTKTEAVKRLKAVLGLK